MEKPKYLYGLMHFEDGHRSVLMWGGTKYWHGIYIDAITLHKRYVLFAEKDKFFKELANSNNNLKEIKRVARFMLKPSKCCGLKRIMSNATKKILKDCLKYENSL